jgi:putative heme-binding domain-containing protein
VLNGVIVEKSDRTLTLQTPTDCVTIDRGEIDATKPSNLSLMPDGMLKQLTPEQTRDLIAYLQSKTQVGLPE